MNSDFEAFQIVAFGIAAVILLAVRWFRIPRHGDLGESRDHIESGAHGFVRLRWKWVRVSNAGENAIEPGDRCRVVHSSGRFVMVVGPYDERDAAS